ncbi:uncharacterized protein LOC142817823 [Rhipicephalus microplus]|uniref:uncharacterized protein LOC142817823 n=1 Tax=Rhipicephalus microplus TaxID=6941 RepID=UPI003F6BC286
MRSGRCRCSAVTVIECQFIMAMVVATAEDTSSADSSAAPTIKGSRPPIQSPQFSSSLRGTASVVVATSRRVHSAARAFGFGTAMALLVLAAARGGLWSGDKTNKLLSTICPKFHRIRQVT